MIAVGGGTMPRFQSESSDYKQHLNLSAEAFSVMESDMFTFGVKSPSTFLNCVFANFYEDAEASIAIRSEQEENKLLCILDAFQDKVTIVKPLIKSYQDELREKANSYSKSTGFKFRINQSNFMYLTEDDTYHEEKYYERIGHYFKAVIEEYAHKPYRDREKIYYAESFSLIAEAVEHKKQISVVLFRGSRHTISPYTVKSDPLSMYHYLVGEEHPQTGNEESIPRFFSYRITNIKEIKLIKSKSAYFTKDERRKLDKALSTRGAQFMNSEASEIRVHLTPNGVNKYQRIVHLRPTYSEILDGNIYVFHCTETQAEYYFFKFGEDAQIIEPASLVSKFKCMYANAVSVYGCE